MNLLTSLHSIFQHEESLRQEEEVEVVGLVEEVEATRLEEEDLDEDRSPRRRKRGTRMVRGCTTWGGG
jgi:hypothetical protein